VEALKYEAMSSRSRYRGFADRIFSEHLLSTGHTYVVRVNDNKGRPRITKVYCLSGGFSCAHGARHLSRLSVAVVLHTMGLPVDVSPAAPAVEQ